MTPTPTAPPSSSTRRAGALVVAAAVLVLGGGAAWRTLWEHGGDRALAWRDVTAGLQDPALTRPVARIFESRRELAGFLRVQEPGRAPSVPAVDFRRRDAILLSTGPRSSTGYAVEVLAVTEQRGRILVRARERTPALGDPVVARLTVPVALITIPKRGKPLDVEWAGR